MSRNGSAMSMANGADDALLASHVNEALANRRAQGDRCRRKRSDIALDKRPIPIKFWVRKWLATISWSGHV